jgi:hypothetical protein
MKKELFFDFFATVHANEWKSLLLIGMNAPMAPYDSFIGFDVHWGNELKLMTWFLIAAGIVFMLSLRWAHNTRERHYVIKVVLGIIFLSVISSFSAVELSTKAFTNADYATETKYYEKLHTVEADLRYEIESYRISLEGKQATAKITLSRLDTMEPTFQLYHAYPIKSVTAGNERVEFERNGDIVKVHLPENTSLLTFQYEIVDTSYVPYMNGRTVLLADKAWYPKKRAAHMYEMNEYIGEIELSERFSPDESYLFTVKAKNALFCNLPKQGEVYRGKAQAVSLIKGQGHQLTYGDYQITYPADWPKMKERVPTVLSLLEKTLHEIQQLAPTTVQSLPKAIVFSNYELSSLMTKDHLIYDTGYGDPVDDYETTKDFQENILELTVQRKNPYSMHREWIHMASHYIRDKNGWRVDLYRRTSYSDNLPKAEQEIVDSIYQAFYQLDVEQQQQFLKKWYEEMDAALTWHQVLDLAER